MDEGHEFYRSDPVLSGCPVKPPDRVLEAMCKEERAYFARVGDYYYGLRVNPWPLFVEAWARVRDTFVHGAVMEPRPDDMSAKWLDAEREALALLMRVTVCRSDTDEWMELYWAMHESMRGLVKDKATKLGLNNVDEAVSKFMERHFLRGRQSDVLIGGSADALKFLAEYSPPGLWKFLPAGYYAAYLKWLLPCRLIDIRRSEEAKRRRELAMTEHLQAVLAAQDDVEADAFAMAELEMIQMEQLFDEITENLSGLRVNAQFINEYIRAIKDQAKRKADRLREKPGRLTPKQVDEAVLKLKQKTNAEIIICHELKARHEHFTDVLKSANELARTKIGEDAKITQYTMYKMHFRAMDRFVMAAIDRGLPKLLLKCYLERIRHSDHDAPREKDIKAQMDEIMKQLAIEQGEMDA